MSKRARVTPEMIRTVKEINDNNPNLCYWEIGKRVGACDETVRRILNNEYEIVGDKAGRIYKKSKKVKEQNSNKIARYKKIINSVYGSKNLHTPNTKYEVAELICLNCLHRWIGVYPTKTPLKNIICSECDAGGCVIKTGQTLDGLEGEYNGKENEQKNKGNT